MTGRRSRAWLLVALSLLLAGCGPFPGQDFIGVSGVVVDNRTSQTLGLKVFSHGSWHPAGSVDAYSTALAIAADTMGPTGFFGTNGCTDGDLVAFSLSGVEFARHAPPLCVDDRWVIEGPTANPAASPSAN